MTNISFENTEIAFEYKSDKELKKAKFLFSTMAKPLLVKLGTKITPLLIKAKFPINGLIRKTIFNQFVGGESLEETSDVVKKLDPFNVQIILDYGVEGKEGEENFDRAAEVFMQSIKYAATQDNIPFLSVKLTGYARFGLLEKLNKSPRYDEIIRGIVPLHSLNEIEKDEWQRVVNRIETICEFASKNNIGVLVDAEETWIQEPVDALTMQMMQKFNLGKAVVYNTAQLYRK